MDGQQQGAGLSKKERGRMAVRQFRKKQKEKEEAEKEKAERLRKENLELESRIASYQQVPLLSVTSSSTFSNLFSKNHPKRAITKEPRNPFQNITFFPPVHLPDWLVATAAQTNISHFPKVDIFRSTISWLRW